MVMGRGKYINKEKFKSSYENKGKNTEIGHLRD
jgi:hypothetical protein